MQGEQKGQGQGGRTQGTGTCMGLNNGPSMVLIDLLHASHRHSHSRIEAHTEAQLRCQYLE